VIDEALINALVPPLPEGDFFETVEAFFARDLNWTLEAIRRHFFAGNDARPMISSLQSRNRLLIQLHVLAGAGAIGPRPSQQQLQRAAERYGKEFAGAEGKSTCNVFSQNPWYLSRLTGALDKFSLRQLIDCQAAFLDAFTGILERPNDQEGVLRETAIRCIG
jgi:DNA polymerase-3 subunit delta